MEKTESMSSFFKDKVVYIFSPQPWNYLQISKHHYARALAKDNEVYFIPPPTNAIVFNFAIEKAQEGLNLIRCTIPSPWFLRTKFPTFYKFVLRYFLSRLLRKKIPYADIVFDFGCYQQFDSLDFVNARYKIFFPVDDFGTLQPNDREADMVLTVSKNIQRKFPEGKCHFINHGLSDEFSERIVRWSKPRQPSMKIRVGCSGNLFIRYLDTSILIQLIQQHPDVEFHFFGSQEVDLSVSWQKQWYNFMKATSNVVLRGSLSAPDLAIAYDDMDAFLLCYKPDYVNYHGENSHKVLEYLSTGKVLVSTYLTIYKDMKLFEMSPRDQNEILISLFSKVIANVSAYNSDERKAARIQFALENTYDKQLVRISDLITNRTEVHAS
jgi:hypothetical protein